MRTVHIPPLVNAIQTRIKLLTQLAPRSLPFGAAILVVAVFFVLSITPLVAKAETIYKYTNSKGEVVFTDQPTKGAQKLNVIPPPVIPLTPINLPPSKPPAPPPSQPKANAELPKATAPMIPSMQMQPPQANPATNTHSSNPAAATSSGATWTPPTTKETSANAPRIIRQPLPDSAESTTAIAPQKRNGHYQSLIITEPKPGAVTAHAGGTIFVQTKLSPELDLSVGDRMRIVIDGNIRVDDSTGQRFMISDLSPGTHNIIAIVMRKGKNIFQSNPVVIHLLPSADGSAQK